MIIHELLEEKQKLEKDIEKLKRKLSKVNRGIKIEKEKEYDKVQQKLFK
jgi:peptidoglycan hydrolase CwlO-like protein